MMLLRILLCSTVLLAGLAARADGTPLALRISAGKNSEEYLQVPVIRYAKMRAPGKGATLDFVGAVHLGDEDYFNELNRRFRGYDAVLYELIADPEHVKHLHETQNDSILGVVQRKLSELLGLTFQLDKVDYSAPNFVHADLTPTEFMTAMQRRGESLPQMIIKILQLSMNPALQKKFEEKGLAPQALGNINPLFIMLRGYATDKEQAALRRFMANGLSISDELLEALEGEQGSTIISDRNKRAIQVLNTELGKGKKKLAVYYGVGHLSDLHKRLVGDLGFVMQKTDWVDAWRLPREGVTP